MSDVKVTDTTKFTQQCSGCRTSTQALLAEQVSRLCLFKWCA